MVYSTYANNSDLTIYIKSIDLSGIDGLYTLNENMILTLEMNNSIFKGI